MAQLFMFTGTDPGSCEYDRSLLVVADTPEEAVDFWVSTYWQDDEGWRATFDTLILKNRPDCEHMTIWAVTVDLSTKGAVDYFTDGCQPVGYLVPSEN